MLSKRLYVCTAIVSFSSMFLLVFAFFAGPEQRQLKENVGVGPKKQEYQSMPDAASNCSTASETSTTKQKKRIFFSRIPISFEENRGQADSVVQFLGRGRGYNLYLTSNEAVMVLRKPQAKDFQRAVLRLRCVNGKKDIKPQGVEPTDRHSNYFIGNNPQKWTRNIPHFGKVRYSKVYPGIDLVYYDHGGELEYDFVVEPGADPYGIVVEFEGLDQHAQGLTVDQAGNLLLHTPFGTVVQKPPYAYQEQEEKRTKVVSRYLKLGPNRVGFEIAAYDTSRVLVIDPSILYSTFIGGGDLDAVADVAVDSAGNAYLTGTSQSTDFPTAGTPFSASNPSPGTRTVFVAKVNPNGDALVYSTYIGGTGTEDTSAIAIDGSGNAYVCGGTQSSDFPLVTPLDSTFAGTAEGFVLKLDPNGSNLVFSTFLGGSGDSDRAQDIVLDSAGSAYVVGSTLSTDFPVTGGSFQTSFVGGGFSAGYAVKFIPDGSALEYSTYLAGSSSSFANGVAVDSSGIAHVFGNTNSSDFPTQSPFQASLNGPTDTFIVKLNAGGTALTYGTFLGGSDNETGFSIVLNASGDMFLQGITRSSDFPTVNPAQASPGNNFDVFVARLDASGSSLVYATYLGGTAFDNPRKITVDSSDNAYVTGQTDSTDFPTQSPIQASNGGLNDAYVTVFDSSGSITFSTYLGGTSGDSGQGIAVDSSGNIYIAGTADTNFPIQGGFQTTSNGSGDGFLAKLGDAAGGGGGSNIVADISGSVQEGSAPLTVTFDASGSVDNTGGVIIIYDWTFGDGNTASTAVPVVSNTYVTPGTFVASVVVTNDGAVSSDPVHFPVVVGDGLTTDTELHASKSALGINFKSHAKDTDADSFSLAGLINPAGGPTDFSAAQVRLLVNDREIGPATTVRSSSGASPRAKGLTFIPILRPNGQFSLKINGADLRQAFGLKNKTGTQSVRMKVELEVSGITLDTPVARGVITQEIKTKQDASSKGKFSFIKLPTPTGFFKSKKTIAKLGKTSGYSVIASGPIEAEFSTPLVPTGDVTLTLGGSGSSGGVAITIPQASFSTKGSGAASTVSYSSKLGAVAELKKFQISNAKKKFVIATTELAGTGIPDLGTGLVSFDLLIQIDVPTASGPQTLTSTVEIQRVNDQSKVWKR